MRTEWEGEADPLQCAGCLHRPRGGRFAETDGLRVYSSNDVGGTLTLEEVPESRTKL